MNTFFTGKSVKLFQKINNFFKGGSLNAVIFCSGFSGVVAQVLLLRELLIVFGGNEMSIGLILANWLVLGGIGSILVGKIIGKWKKSANSLVLALSLFPFLIMIAMICIRFLKNFLGIGIGEGFGLSDVFLSSLIILTPVSFLNGAVFGLACKAFVEFTEKTLNAVASTYIFSTLGTVFGGVVWTFVLLPLVDAFSMILILNIINFAAIIWLQFSGKDKTKINIIISVSILAISSYLLLFNWGSYFDRLTIEQKWHPLNVLEYRNSVYGNWVVTEKEGHYAFFMDGLEYSTVPIPDIKSAEEFVHTAMVTHPEPRDILVLGRGAGGIIYTILKHPQLNIIDYAELDPLTIELKRKYTTPLTFSELNDERVRIKHIDGRIFLQSAGSRYDLIFVGKSNPSDIRSNRYFTREFFSMAKDRLLPYGILVISAPGCLTLLTEELRDLNSSIYSTLNSVFSYVRPFPKANRTIFFASDQDHIINMDNDLFIYRLNERNMLSEISVPWHIESMLHPGWTKWFEDFTRGGSTTINRDFSPKAVFYSVSHWNTRFADYLRIPFRILESINLPMGIFILTIPLVYILLFKKKKENAKRHGVMYSIGTTGFAGMVIDLVLIFSFQAVFGYVFSWIGLLVSFFMAGIGFGAFWINSNLPKISNTLKLFKRLDIILMLFTVIFAFGSYFVDEIMLWYGAVPILKVIFLAFSISFGFLVGAQFPLAHKICSTCDEGDVAKEASILYGADLLGGGVGGVLGGVILLPLLGVFGTCIIILFIKSISFAIMMER